MNSENQNNILENKSNFKCRNDCEKCVMIFTGVLKMGLKTRVYLLLFKKHHR